MKTHPFICASLLMAGGCLSIDQISTSNPAPKTDAGGPDASQGDAGETEDSGPRTAACIDRGSYELFEDYIIEGLTTACKGHCSTPEACEIFSCVEGKCVPTPTCAPGVKGECVFPSQGEHGATFGFTVRGDYLYWLEMGSTDRRGNYQYDAVLARTIPGEWTREEVRSGFDFYDESTGDLYAVSQDLKGYQHSNWLPLLTRDGAFALSIDGARQVPVEVDDGGAVVGDALFYGLGDSGAGASGIYRRDLLSGDVSKVAAIEHPRLCLENALVVNQQLVCWDGEVNRFIGTSEPYPVSTARPGLPLMAANGDYLVGLRSGWLATVPFPEEGASLKWINIAPVGINPRLLLTTHEGSVFWGRRDRHQRESLLLTTRLDGQSEMQVLTEMPDGSTTSYSNTRLFVTKHGVVYGRSIDGGLHYVPHRAP